MIDDSFFVTVVVIAVAVGALVKAYSVGGRLADSEQKIDALMRLVSQLRNDIRLLEIGATPAPKVSDERFEADHVERPAVVRPVEPAPPPRPAAAPLPPPMPARPSIISQLEDELTSRWLVWLGALAIALSGAFFVKYAIDHELLGPAARVTIGVIGGLVLAVAGEWLRQRPLQRAIAAVRPDYVPPALTASGLFVAFVSLYAGYAVYGLLNPLVAFAGLSLIAFLAVGLSLLQGGFVALLGLVGAFVTPALVQTSSPSAWSLCTYLLVVEAGCLALVRYRGWWWLAFATLAGVAAWPLIWMLGGFWHLKDALPFGLYLVASATAFFVAPVGLDPSGGREELFDELFHLEPPEHAVLIAGSVLAAVLFVMVAVAGHSTTSLVLFAAAIAIYLVIARSRQSIESLSIVAALATLAVLLTMSVPSHYAVHNPPAMYPALVPAELARFASANFVLGAMFAVGGFVVLWGARRPGLWASVSAGVPVALLIAAYSRIVAFHVDLRWAGLSLALAAAALFAAERVARYRDARGLDVSLGMYAAAVVGLLSLAAAMSIREAWLTVALAVELPAIAWIRRHVPVRALDLLAALIAQVVLVRLVFNYNVLNYPLESFVPLNWILYGYGVPALAFLGAAWLLRNERVGALVTALEAGALIFFVLLLTLEIRVTVTGSLEARHYGIFEQSLQTIAWLSVGGGLATLHRWTQNPVAYFGARALIVLGAAQIVFLELGFSNPLFTGESVGGAPLLDGLLLAYAVPAVLAFWLVFTQRPSLGQAAPIVEGAGFALAFVYLSLEVRRAFHGPVLTAGSVGDAEIYTYSLAWLVYAAALLGAAIFLRASSVRYAALTVLALTCTKVFLFDMSGLTGLYRAASFLGLGLSLVGIGFLYQRFVLARPDESPKAAELG